MKLQPRMKLQWSPVIRSIPVVLTLLYCCASCDMQQGNRVGETPPAFSDIDIAGEQVSLGKLKGKVVLLYFWTRSCCGDSLKELELFYRKFKDQGLEIIAVNELDSRQEVLSYAAGNGVTFHMLSDEKSMLLQQYQVYGFPTIFVIDRGGLIAEKIQGEIRPAELGKRVRAHLENRQQK